MKAADLEKMNKPPKILIYGAAGSGKTALVSQARNGYLFDFDEGMRTALKLKDDYYDDRMNIEFDEFRDKDPGKPVGWITAKGRVLEISSQIAHKKFPYDAVIIDSLTGLAQAVQNQVMAQAGKPNGKPEIQHWGMIVSEIENILTILTSLNTLVMITAHEVPVLTRKGSLGHPEEDVHAMRVLCAGKKLPEKLPWMFDEFWHADSKTVGGKSKFTLSGIKTTYIQARTRSGFTKCEHTKLGLKGVLDLVGYKYGDVASVNNDVSSLLT